MGEALEPAYFMMDTPAPTLLGASSYGQGEFLLGYVSEVVVYNRALSEAEVAGIQEYFDDKYALTVPVPHDPLAVNVNFQPLGTPKVQGLSCRPRTDVPAAGRLPVRLVGGRDGPGDPGPGGAAPARPSLHRCPLRFIHLHAQR